MKRNHSQSVGDWCIHRNNQGNKELIILSDDKHEESYDGRLSRTVLWERKGEIPMRDPIRRQRWTVRRKQQESQTVISKRPDSKYKLNFFIYFNYLFYV